jgi:SAM-dependent methyltransferase
MAHKEQQDFCRYVKELFPDRFKNSYVLDIGSLDINGSIKEIFENSEYVGVDVGPGKNVDVVSRGHLYHSDRKFDVVSSAECFEHDENYGLTIHNMYRLLKPGGLFFFTCASEGRAEHGTRRTTPQNAPYIAEMGDYYKNLVEKDIRDVINISELFYKYEFQQRSFFPEDLYFWGLKKFGL